MEGASATWICFSWRSFGITYTCRNLMIFAPIKSPVEFFNCSAEIKKFREECRSCSKCLQLTSEMETGWFESLLKTLKNASSQKIKTSKTQKAFKVPQTNSVVPRGVRDGFRRISANISLGLLLQLQVVQTN